MTTPLYLLFATDHLEFNSAHHQSTHLCLPDAEAIALAEADSMHWPPAETAEREDNLAEALVKIPLLELELDLEMTTHRRSPLLP